MPVRNLVATILALVPLAAAAQIAGDGTLGTSIGRAGNAWSITAGTQNGGNLFHSFSQFSVLTGHSATFSGPSSVNNVIGRVTGASASSIDGLLRSTIPGANLWLINPKGVAFGPNASLDIGGSFHVSTADYLKLGTSGQFNATNPGASTLSSAPPSAFGFVSAPASISVVGNATTRATLEVHAGKGLSLVGGDLQLEWAKLRASGGRIDMASLGSAGEVTLVPTGIAASGVSAWGSIGATHSMIDVGGSLFAASGTVSIVGGNLTLSNSRILSDDNSVADPNPNSGIRISLAGGLLMDASSVTAANDFAGYAGNIGIVAGGTVELRNASEIRASSDGIVNSGDVSVKAGAVLLSDASLVSTEAHLGGNGGALTVTADTIVDVATRSKITASTDSLGDAGSVTVKAATVRLTGGGTISSSNFLAGNGGNVTVDADSVYVSGSSPGGSSSGIFASSESTLDGNAGTLTVNAGSIELLDGGVISGSTFGRGAGGAVNVTARGNLHIEGKSPFNVRAGIYANSTWTLDDGGNAGVMVVDTDSIHVGRGGVIEAATKGEGNAGGILLRAREITLSDGGYVNSSTTGAGRGGDVVIDAPDARLRIAGSGTDGVVSAIFANASTGSTGNAGSITVLVDSLELADGGAIVAGAFGSGRGGDLSIGVNGRLSITGAASTYSGIYASTATGSTGSAGSALIVADSIAVDRGLITANTNGSGAAGSLVVVARDISLSNGGIIASDTFGSGRGGNVGVTATENLQMSGSGSLGFAGIFARSRNANSGDAGLVTVDAGGIQIGTGGGISAETEGAGNAGGVAVRANSIDITGGGLIGSITLGSGRGGDVTLDVRDRLAVGGESSGGVSGVFATSAGGASGNAGSLTVRAGDIELRDGGAISAATFSPGNAGALSVSARGLVQIAGSSPTGYLSGIFGSAETGATGAAGTVVVSADTLSIGGDGMISANTKGPKDAGALNVNARVIELVDGGQIGSSTFAGGRGGNVTINASERMRAVGGAGALSSGVFSTSEPTASNDAGSITLNAGALELRDGGVLTATTFSTGKAGDVSVTVRGPLTIGGLSPGGYGSGIVSAATTGATGAAGQVSVQAGSISIGEWGEISTNTRGPGNAGNVQVGAGAIQLNGGAIQSLSTGTGQAGNILITADRLTLTAGGSISTEASASDGGNIVIKAGELVYLKDSQISASVNELSGSGGNVTIDPIFVVLDHSEITAKAKEGLGGNIRIVADFFLNFDSEISASSEKGLPGKVEINSPNVNVGSGVVVLGAGYLDASSLIRASCASRAGRADSSSFTGVGRGGLAAGPAVLATSPAEGAYRLSQISSSCGE